jgi:hypothetical protein
VVDNGKIVYAYGASTKGNTLLQYFGLNKNLITKIADKNQNKLGLKTIGTEIPICSEEEIFIFVKFDFNNKTSFDAWITLSSLGNKLKICIPLNKSKHFNLEIESKRIVETKLTNRFYNDFFENLVLEAVLPGHRNINVGQIYEIALPSSYQGKGNMGGNKEETLSGDWLLYQVKHVIKYIKGSDGLRSYETLCTFIRTGLTLSNRHESTQFTS